MRTVAKMVLAVALGVALTIGLAVPVQAEVLYGITDSDPGVSLYTISTSTGAATHYLNLSGVIASSLGDLASLNALRYATTISPSSGPPQFTFGSINPTTGAYTVINNQNGSSNWQSLAANPAKNLFYTVDVCATGALLLSVTPGGTITNIGFTNVFINALTFDSNHNILYGTSHNNLYTINTTTGAATLVGATGFTNDYEGIAYDNATNTLYLNTGTDPNHTLINNDSLYTLNTTTARRDACGVQRHDTPRGKFGNHGIAFQARHREPAASPH